MAQVDPPRYEIPNDVHMRLHNCIVRYQNIPVQVYAGGEDLTVNLRPLDRETGSLGYIWKRVDANESDLDVSSPPFGYVNLPDKTIYLQRVPTRKQYQGAHPTVMKFFSEAPKTLENLQNDNLNSYFYKEPVKNTIENNYPKGIQALEEILSKKIYSRAFHRKFSLAKDDIGIIKLKHMTKTFGWLQPGTNICVIPNELYNDIFAKVLDEHGFELKG